MIRQLTIVLGLVLPLFAQDGIGPQVQVTSTERVNFAPGGTIHLDGSYGYLTVAGWDQPEVEIVVKKSLQRFGESGKQDDQRRLESIHVTTDRKSSTDLVILTTLASRHGDWAPPLPAATTNGVTAEYELHVPRDSRLVIHHGVGYVQVSGVSGDIDARVRRGDIMLWMPATSYSIDARTRFGKVTSQFDGAVISQYMIGQHFTRENPSASRRLYLRTGFGGITIQTILPESEAPVAARIQ